MSDVNGLLALGQELDDHLAAAFEPPPGTATALGFLPGIPVNPTTLQNNGTYNPARVNAFQNFVADRVAPIVDGRFAGSLLAAHQLYAALLAMATPLPGAEDAVAQMKTIAGAAFGPLNGLKDVLAAPADWYDPAAGGWSHFATSTARASTTETAVAVGDDGLEPLYATERFERLWRWRTMDLPPVEAPVPRPVLRRTAPRAMGLMAPPILDDAEPTGARRATKPAAMRNHGLMLAMSRRAEFADRIELRRELDPNDAEVLEGPVIAEMIDQSVPAVVSSLDEDVATTSTQTVQSRELTLSLDYRFVELRRDAWWNDMLVRMGGWYAAGTRAGGLVPGASSPGLTVGVPIALVVTRDVRVEGRWSETDRLAAGDHTHFGPWDTTTSEFRVETSTEAATFLMPTPQVVAVICSVLPPLPPADDPALTALPVG